jgi:hypothetical protein
MTFACLWFATCDRAADGLRTHPVLGQVPSCERCARAVDAPLTDLERQKLHAVAQRVAQLIEESGCDVEVAAERALYEEAHNLL